MLKKITYLLLFFCCVNVSFSQENSGIVHSNYAPTNSVLINPSSIGDSKVFWEINLIGASLFIDNNYLYVPKSSVLSLALNANTVNDPIDITTSGNKFAFTDLSLHGPSFYMNLGKHAVGLTSQLRQVVDARNIDVSFAKFMLEGFNYKEQRGIEYTISNSKINSMAWGEIGINYAYTFKQNNNNMYIGGISLKRLYGLYHIGTNIKDATLIVPDTNNINLSNVNAKYGFSNPALNAGRGWALDLGFTYKKTLDKVNSYIPYSIKSGCKKSNYLYKLGISILDLGYLFYSSDSYYGEVEGSGTWENYLSNEAGDDSDAYQDKIIASFSNNSNRKTSYNAQLPTALSVQFDYNFQNGIYINGSIIQNISLFNNLGVNRQNLLVLTPRFELPRFEVALPLSLKRYNSPSFGLAFRFWNNLIIGSDRLGSLLFNGDLYGTDIYFSIKIAKLYTNRCGPNPSKRIPRTITNDCHFIPNMKWGKR